MKGNYCTKKVVERGREGEREGRGGERRKRNCTRCREEIKKVDNWLFLALQTIKT